MPDEGRLRGLARRAIQSGQLPREPPKIVWAGTGSGVSCAVCAQPITPAEQGMDVHVSLSGGLLEQFHFHLRCYAVWELERTKPGTSENPL